MEELQARHRVVVAQRCRGRALIWGRGYLAGVTGAIAKFAFFAPNGERLSRRPPSTTGPLWAREGLVVLGATIGTPSFERRHCTDLHHSHAQRLQSIHQLRDPQRE